ncbi:S1/P1 Nuclease [Pseudoflavitalea sp. G-6-1-2]|uniref:zinc dependent phospholipase C family protein n=1 Tax=Pseudoflavitalea sp. G-6-1-2 TaxID=2728841 RepID=UPI00146B172B|nr:zinc dependent phospholipase C family protein [Pseudoflavitalea sp. G-6-1-2]NML20320.1 S1/P1 Nuclease [Pseudoflavitalea sp. G-6-1-2]
MKTIFALCCMLLSSSPIYSWGFYAHRLINFQAVFLLPPEMLVFFKHHIRYLQDHAVDPDRRRYILPQEAARHYIDLDHYGPPYDSLPRNFRKAQTRYTLDSLQAHGIVPWWLQVMQQRLTKAFREKQTALILRLAADLGHYLGDAHVPLHACSNYDGQFTNQRGIHALWESALPELFAEEEWILLTPRANYLPDPSAFFWNTVFESAAAVDTVLSEERAASALFPQSFKYAYRERNGVTARQFSIPFLTAYHRGMNDMTERRLRTSIHAVASAWYTAWLNAGQPDLSALIENGDSTGRSSVEWLNKEWIREASQERKQ